MKQCIAFLMALSVFLLDYKAKKLKLDLLVQTGDDPENVLLAWQVLRRSPEVL